MTAPAFARVMDALRDLEAVVEPEHRPLVGEARAYIQRTESREALAHVLDQVRAAMEGVAGTGDSLSDELALWRPTVLPLLERELKRQVAADGRLQVMLTQHPWQVIQTAIILAAAIYMGWSASDAASLVGVPLAQ